MDRNQRPRTKKLERPTPHLKHPVVINKKTKEMDSELNECIEGIDKCETTYSKNVSNKSPEVKQSSMSSMSGSGNQCHKCERKISSDSLKCHHLFKTNKSSIMRCNKSGNNPSIPKKALKDGIKRADLMEVDDTKKGNDCTQCPSVQSLSIHKMHIQIESVFVGQKKISKHSVNGSIEENNWSKIKKENERMKETNESREGSRVDAIAKESGGSDGWQHFKAQLIPCSRCLRTFFPHRLPIHEKSCKGIGGTGVAICANSSVGDTETKYSESDPTESDFKLNACPKPFKPTFLECTTCGRKYSTSSLTLHELKCRTNNNSKRLGTGKSENPSELSSAWDHFKSQLVSCRKCNRKFLADRLEKHEPNCKASPVNKSTKLTNNKFNNK